MFNNNSALLREMEEEWTTFGGMKSVCHNDDLL